MHTTPGTVRLSISAEDSDSTSVAQKVTSINLHANAGGRSDKPPSVSSTAHIITPTNHALISIARDPDKVLCCDHGHFGPCTFRPTTSAAPSLLAYVS